MGRGVVRRAVLVGLVLLSASCQTAGYNTGERVEIDCDRSPIQSSWSNVYTPTWGKCYRVTSDRAEVMSTAHLRHFQIPGGYADVVHHVAGHNTFIAQGDLRSAVRIYKRVAANGADWGEPRNENLGGEEYETQTFLLSGKSCMAFRAKAAPAATLPGYRSATYGYACANRLDRELVERLLPSFSYDIARAENAPVKPIPPTPAKRS